MATLIISTEYHRNTPSVFLHQEGKYYGCKIYPSIRNYPDVSCWKTATCSDSDRFFAIHTVELTEDVLKEVQKLQNVIDANESMVLRKSYEYISKNWTIRRGKKYIQWKEKTEAQAKEMRREAEFNKPFEQARSVAYRIQRDLLLSLIK